MKKYQKSIEFISIFEQCSEEKQLLIQDACREKRPASAAFRSFLAAKKAEAEHEEADEITIK